MYSPPFKSDIFYSVQNEDYRTELAVLEWARARRAIACADDCPSGENVLSVLTRDTVAGVDAVDLSPAQLLLCELRRTALEHLTRDEQLHLLGADPSIRRAEGEAERLALYDRIRPFLPEPAREFWDARRAHELAFGVHHVGRNDAAMHDIQAGLHAAGFEPLKRPLGADELPGGVANGVHQSVHPGVYAGAVRAAERGVGCANRRPLRFSG